MIKLEQAYIYGFGKWVDYEIKFPTNHFVCVVGNNETGKSTLQNFILFMLFGLPPRKREFYRPKTSGKMGGRLMINDADIGLYTIERVDEVHNGAARCFYNGKEYDEIWLEQRLNGLTAEIYNSIYSFSALDLVDITDMTDKDLGDILLGIGLTGSRNIHTIEKQLDQQIGALFKPYGKKPIINEQLQTVDELYTDLQKFKQNESTYEQKQSEITSLKNKLEQLQENLEKTNEQLFTIQKQQQALPLIHEYQKNIQQLKKYEDIIKFPENGIQRLQLLKEKMLPIKSEYAILQSNFQKAEQKSTILQEQIVDESLYQAAEEIYNDKQRYYENIKEIERIQRNIDELSIKINTKLKELNIGVEQKHLMNISFPFHIEQTWNELKNNAERFTLEKEQLDHEKHSLTKQQSFLKSELTRVEEKLLSDAHIEKLDQQINEFTANQQNLRWQEATKRKKKKNNLLFIGSVMISFILIGIAYYFQQVFLYNLPVITFFFGLIQWIIGRNSLKEIANLIGNQQKSVGSISAQEKNEAEETLLKQDQLRDELYSIQEQLKIIDVQIMKYDEKRKLLIQQEDRLNQQIGQQISEYDFLQKIEVIFWPELFHSLKNLQHLKSEQQQYIKRSQQLKEHQQNIKQSLNKVLESLKINIEEKSTLQFYNVLEEFLREQSNKKIELNQYHQQLIEYKNQLPNLQEKIKIYEQEIHKLFSIAQVKTEEEYHQKAKQFQEQQTLILEQAKLKEQLQMTFPKKHWKKIRELHVTQTQLELQNNKNMLQKETIEQQIEQVRQKLANLNADLINMESSESYSLTMHQYQMEREQLHKLSLDWAILKTAKEILDTTKNSYREKHLTQVIEKTSYYFSYITEGAYQRIYAPDNDRKFQVEDKNGIFYQINELSRGTIDQLYVSLRIAISEIMSHKHHLPFMIDDAFINFDTIRSKRMIDILIDLSVNQQIILFTFDQKLVDNVCSKSIIHLNTTTRIL